MTNLRYARYSRIAAVVAFGLLSLRAYPALAGSGTGKVQLVQISEGTVIFSLENHQSAPLCQNEFASWAIALARPEAKPMLAMLLQARVSDQVLVVSGAGTCDDVGYSERPVSMSFGSVVPIIPGGEG